MIPLQLPRLVYAMHPLATALAARGNQNMKPRYHVPQPLSLAPSSTPWLSFAPPVAFFIKTQSQLARNCQQLLRLAPRPCPACRGLAWLGLACPARFPLAV